MSKKLYEESSIQDIADAIRAKNGTQNVYAASEMADAVLSLRTNPILESLSVSKNGYFLPSSGIDGFSDVIVNVPSGGSDDINRFIDGTISEVIAENASIVRSSIFYKTDLTKSSFPECIIINNDAFGYCYGLSEVSFPKCTQIGSAAFLYCSALTKASFPECTLIDERAFYGCLQLSEISFPKCTGIGISAFYNCSALTKASFPACSTLGAYAFQNCVNLSEVFFQSLTYFGSTAFRTCSRLTSLYMLMNWVVSCAETVSTAFHSSFLRSGHIYVLSELYDQYISAIGWSKISSIFSVYSSI